MRRTDRVIKALANHPDLMFDLIHRLIHDDVTVASDWCSEGLRTDPADNCVAQVMEPHGHDYNYTWWTWDDTVGTAANFEEAMDAADRHLQSEGWVLC